MSMENDSHSFLSSYWQDLNTVVDRDDISPREKAEGYRKILKSLEQFRTSKLISEKLYNALYTSAHRKYTAVVDCMNNEEESQSWKSSLFNKDSKDSQSFLSEILEKAKISESQPATYLTYKGRASKKVENTKETSCEDTAVLKRLQKNEGMQLNTHARPFPSSKPRRTLQGSDSIREPRANEYCLSESKANMAQSGTSSSAMPCSNRNKNKTKNPNSFAERSILEPKVIQNLQTPMNSSSANQHAAFTKRKFGGMIESSNKQARLEGHDVNKMNVSDQLAKCKPANGCSRNTLNLYANSKNQIPEKWNNLEQRNEASAQLSNRNSTETSIESVNQEKLSANTFLTARDQYIIDQRTKNRSASETRSISQSDYGTTKKSLGTSRRTTSNRFIPPVMNKQQNEPLPNNRTYNHQRNSNHEENMDERLKNIDPRMIEMIENEIMDHGPAVTWNDIAGLEFAKNTIQEIVIWPMLRPDIFKGLRGPPKGLLLFGPPGTGKTLIGKCIASQSHATFFSISASSLTSKWIGEGEKMVRALFGVARCQESAVIFIDEIDSLLSQRCDGEHEATRRIKTEFLIQLDGATTKAEERILVVGATNRPQELDEAARRRLVKRLYIPLPEAEARKQIVTNLMKEQRCSLDENDLNMIMENSHGYSGADMANLCREAALGPIRSISQNDIRFIKSDEVRPIIYKDFQDAFKNIRPSVSQKDLELYIEWNKQYGSGGV